MIYILTGKVRTGKTTALIEWCKARNDVDGILCPDDKEGKRYFLNIKSKEKYELEAKDNEKDVVLVGPYRFLKSSFQRANSYLIDVNKKRNSKYLIIDELGKLELKNEGLHLSAKNLIPQFLNNENYHLILVVRESLLEEIIKHYKISEFSVFKKDDFKIV